ncbi:DUF5050 domain-containing protein [Clostridiaceae bacterium M8S5]|nr:DUF5050 domain-containing protein [Clostridiaceae bacterium M8S5]
MGSVTDNLKLYKANPVEDRDEKFDIKKMLNDNWDKVDEEAHKIKHTINRQLKENEANIQLGIIDSRMVMTEKEIGFFENYNSKGFFDTFVNNNEINIEGTTATWNSNDYNVEFSQNDYAKFKSKTYPKFDNISLNLYYPNRNIIEVDKKINKKEYNVHLLSELNNNHKLWFNHNMLNIENVVKTKVPHRIKLMDSNPVKIEGYEGWIYYTDSSNRLYKIRVDGSNKVLLGNRIINFKISEGLIYCTHKERDCILKMDLNGANSQVLLYCVADEIDVDNEWIYFRRKDSDYNLYKMKKDGSGLTKLVNDHVQDIFYYKNWIYYKNLSDDRLLYKIRINGNERTIMSGKRMYKYCIEDNFIYYIDNIDNNLYGLDINRKSSFKVWKCHARDIAIKNNWIYYGEDKGLYRIKIDGSCYEKINNDFGRGIYLYDDYLYYRNSSDYEYLYKTSAQPYYYYNMTLSEDIEFKIGEKMPVICFCVHQDDKELKLNYTDGFSCNYSIGELNTNIANIKIKGTKAKIGKICYAVV